MKTLFSVVVALTAFGVVLAEGVSITNDPQPQWIQNGMYLGKGPNGTSTPNSTATSTNPLVVFGGQTYNGDLTVNGDAGISGNMTVTGNPTFSSGATFSSSASVAGAFTASSALNRGKGQIVGGLVSQTANISSGSICTCILTSECLSLDGGNALLCSTSGSTLTISLSCADAGVAYTCL